MEILILILCLGVVLVFEFVNGMNDTANAIAPVIYSHSLEPRKSVLIAASLNFLGVMFGGIAVAMSILHLLPVDAIINAPTEVGVFLIIAILLSSIVWDLGAWWLALPVSSSHALIGSIIGVSIAFSMTTYGAEVIPNWHKAQEVIEGLLLSPVIGFGLALVLMLGARHYIHVRKYFNTPNHAWDHPSLDMRTLLIGASGLVSFMHGKNDGQKGVGIATLILMILLPAHFILNPDIDLKAVSTDITIVSYVFEAEKGSLSPTEKIAAEKIIAKSHEIEKFIHDADLTLAEKKSYRRNMDAIQSEFKSTFAKTDNGSINTIRPILASLATTTDYVPWWIITLVSIAIGSGTLVGWQRIVETIGEKIGKYKMNYSQAAASALVTAGTIGLASGLGLPVSTTHVMSSSVAGTMVEEHGWKNGVDPHMIRHILLAWVLTMPTTLVLAGSIFYVLQMLFVG